MAIAPMTGATTRHPALVATKSNARFTASLHPRCRKIAPRLGHGRTRVSTVTDGMGLDSAERFRVPMMEARDVEAQVRLVIALEQHFFRDGDGRVWTTTDLGRRSWDRYLGVFDSVRIVARTRAVAAVEPGWTRVDGDGVSVAPVPDFVGPGETCGRSGGSGPPSARSCAAATP